MKVFVRVTALLFAASYLAVCGAALSASRLDTTAVDRNGDGRPDIWRHFDAAGRITRVDVDTNSDGRPDIEEYYQRGTLVRRESDRDFNGQADLVEEFDAETRNLTRAIVDVDYDGTADMLVLFRDGRAVFSTTSCQNCRVAVAPPGIADAPPDGLRPMADPFASEAALHDAHSTATDPGLPGLSTSGGLPGDPAAAVSTLAPSSFVVLADVHPRTPARLLPRSPRAPPAVA